MKTFLYVEDYLEIINGDRDPTTGKSYGLFASTPPILSLARYDVQIINSMSAATLEGRALTDKQAELAVKIISKYKKQLEKQGIDISPIEDPNFRLGVRQIDRRKLLYIDNDKIVLKFPYDTKLIDDIRDLAKISQGRWHFSPEAKIWQLAITETNVIAANGFAVNHQFDIADNFKSYLNAVIECEKIPYEIKLIKESDKLEIINSPHSLIESIKNYCGFNESSLDLIVDNAPIYGYTVDKLIEEKIINNYSPRIYNLLTSREIKFSPQHDSDTIQDIIKYARITGRFPIYIFEPDMSDKLFKYFVEPYFTKDEIHKVNILKPESTISHKKIIYFNKFNPRWKQPIKLLISGQGMMHGADKSMLLQHAEKVVYFATEVYNNKNNR